MKIAFIHYHLKTGGVTAVLRQQVEAIKDACQVLVLAGDRPQSPFPAHTVYVPGLAYDEASGQTIEPEDVAESIVTAIFSNWKTGCDVLHVHNPTLAKNKNFFKILKALQKRKIKFFLQIHDFAEDGRPLSYFQDEYLPDCHYGVINSRDYNILLKAGLKKEGLHQIFNTIIPFNLKMKSAAPQNIITYPVRAIRRKNIGEAILLSLFFSDRETLSITLPPNSPVDIKSYKGWKDFVKEKNLNVEFETGTKYDFAELVISSKFLITTSITEGFGFSFLEPWTAKKILWGRKLPGICHDFEKNGIRLDHLYTKLLVPVEWIGKDTIYEKWKSCIIKSAEQFNFVIDEKNILNSFAKITQNDNIDFGLLDEAFQKQIISRALSGKKNKEMLINLNPYLTNPADIPDKDKLIQNNMNVVLKNYNKAIYKEKLINIYSSVAQTKVRHNIDKKILLAKFFNLEEFSLLKWGDYVE